MSQHARLDVGQIHHLPLWQTFHSLKDREACQKYPIPGGEEPYLPDSIYQQLDYLERTLTYAIFAEEEGDSYDEVSEDEDPLDLSAPPPDSWYHGNISRQESYERLQNMAEPGAYLVRDSTNQPGDYAIAYLSKHRQIHHFKINSVCGDYYIGGRQFSSLVDLIGYYTNCSCILENERLEVPVMPPMPVRLHRLLRALAPHVKTAGTDELNVEPGEVFVLLSQLNEDWGWGQSQLTGDGGLIPIILMEDVSHEDQNFGKPWFHSSITRDKAVDLLQRQGAVGDFLVRPAQNVGQYSLAVKTYDRVQRFLIQKHATGYYVFGGRMFNSLDAVVERYKKEIILDGLKLEIPIPNEFVHFDVQYHLEATSQSDGHRNRTNSIAINRDMPGDKAGCLQLRKGKKSPVYGKWKEFYFHFKYKEQKLLYYDNERSHRPRGLLDLKECKIYSVHPSLYGRDDCFVITLQYLNELSFHYIAAGTVKAAQEWLRFMRQCVVMKKPLETRSEVQQIRSLSLSVKDCKLTKVAHSQIYCLIAVDGTCVARTRPISEQSPCIFDENYRFEDLPLYSGTVNVDVNAMKKGLWIPKDASIGGVQLQLTKLPNGQQFDQWHTLVIPGTKASKGSLRVIATFKHEVILPLDAYRSLSEVIMDNDLVVIETMSKVFTEHHQELATTLIEIFCHHQRVLQIISKCLAKVIQNEENMATLFRASTLATMLMERFMKLTAMDYLLSVLRKPIHDITTSTESCELNPSYLPRGMDSSKNQERLEMHLSNILDAIYASVDSCPIALRYIFQCLREEVSKKWGTDNGVRTRVVCGFLFLRFICPAVLKPHLFHITTEPPSSECDRSLKLVTKSIQNVANLVEFTKEPFMAVMNSFICKHMGKMKKFVDHISTVKEIPSVNHPSSDPARAWASLYRLCQTYEQKLKDASQNEPKIMELLAVMQMLKQTEARFLSKGHI